MQSYYHIPPKGGWEPQSHYVVEVSAFKGNPIFRAILYTGFLNGKDNQPGGYSGLFIGTSECYNDLRKFKYIKAISKIDMSIPNAGKQIEDLHNVFELEYHKKER